MGAFESLQEGDPQQVGPYRLVARLGAGGMGRVYLGRSKTGRAVAVKVIRPNLAEDGEFRRRFAREVAVARTVSGFFTAGVVAADPQDAQPWLATAYVPGMPLDRAVAEHGPWPEASVLALGAGLAEALESIHAAGVVHRDLKPSNVLLAADGPRVIDFGISVATEGSKLTQTGMAVGSPGFMSPEQFTGEPVGPPSDVFCLGAVLAFTATGTGPFGTGSLPAIIYRIISQEPDLTMLPPMLRSVVARCLAKQPEQRPSARALLDELAESITAKTSIVEFFAESAWMPDGVAQVVRARVATPLPTPSPTPPGRPLGPPRTPPNPYATEHPEAQAQPPHPIVRPAAMPPDGDTQERHADRRQTGGNGSRDLPRQSNGGGPHREAVADGAAGGRPAGISRRTAMLGLAGIGVAATAGIIGRRLYADDSGTGGLGKPTAQPQRTPGKLQWTFTTDGSVDSSPVVVGGVVYVGSDDRRVYAIDAATGRERWSFATAGIISSPAVAEGAVYVGSGDLKAYAIDAATGRERWSFATAAVVSSPVVAEGAVYVGDGGGKVYALDAATGRRRWSFTAGAWIGSSPTVVGGVVYVGSADGKVYALDAATGRRRWSFTAGDYVSSTPAVVGGWVYVGSGDGKVYALDAASGGERWSFITDHAVHSPTVVEGVVYVGNDGGKVYAIDVGSGRERWSFTPGGWVHASPAVVGGVVYVGRGTGGGDGKVYALDAASGRERWSFSTGDDVRSSPAVAGGVVYVGSRDGKLYAITADSPPARKNGS